MSNFTLIGAVVVELEGFRVGVLKGNRSKRIFFVIPCFLFY